MKNSIPGIGLAVLFSCNAHAQSPLPGTYSGYYLAKLVTGERAMGLTLEIATVEGNHVTGTASRMAMAPRPPCNGSYPVEGKLKGDLLFLRAIEKGGPTKECGMMLRLKVEDGRLIGTMNGVRAELSK